MSRICKSASRRQSSSQFPSRCRACFQASCTFLSATRRQSTLRPHCFERPQTGVCLALSPLPRSYHSGHLEGESALTGASNSPSLLRRALSSTTGSALLLPANRSVHVFFLLLARTLTRLPPATRCEGGQLRGAPALPLASTASKFRLVRGRSQLSSLSCLTLFLIGHAAIFLSSISPLRTVFCAF